MKDERFAFSDCPLTRSMGLIGTKWKPIIINALQTRKLRFGQLDAIVPLITRKVLTEQLRELEEDELVKREVFNEIPPRVDYSLTPKGLALLPVLSQIVEWNSHYESLKATDGQCSDSRSVRQF